MNQLAKTSSKSLFEYYQLDKIFKREEYGKDRNFTVHFLFALSEPIEKIIKHMEKLVTSCKTRINTGYGESNLSALHIAVIKGNYEGAQALIAHGAEVNARDAHGWTPLLHTAFLTDFVGLKQLLEDSGAVVDEERWHQLREQAGFEISANSNKKILVSIRDERLPLNQNILEILGLKSYTDAILFEPDQYLYIWQLEETMNSGRSKKERVLYSYLAKSFLSQCPQLCIQPNPQISNQRNYGLYSIEDLEPGALVGWYSGKAQEVKGSILNPFQHLKNFQQIVLRGMMPDYCVKLGNALEVNALTHGNGTRFANDGWPNSGMELLSDRGLGMFAIEFIKAETEITWDYGPGCPNIKWGGYALMKKEEMREFYGSRTLTKCFETANQLKMDLMRCPETDEAKLAEIYIKTISHEIKLKFIFHTPLALIYLIMNGTLKTDDAISLLKQPSFRNLINFNDYLGHFLWILSIINMLRHIEKSMNDLEKEIRAFFVDNIIGALNVTQVVKALQQLELYLKNDWGRSFLQSDWASILSDFKWEADEDRPLGFCIEQGGYMRQPREKEFESELGISIFK